MTRLMYFVYILTNQSRTLYIGVTNNLELRLLQHKSGEVPGFTKKYKINRLVYFEVFQEINDALNREKQLKGLLRVKKMALIESTNPYWKDLGSENVSS